MELVASFDSPEAFDRINAALASRMARNEKQLLSHGAETHWGKIHALLERLDALPPHDPRLAALSPELDYVYGQSGPWSGSARAALLWCRLEISAAIDIAKNVRSKEVFHEIQHFSKLSHALIRSRSTRSKTQAVLLAIQELAALAPEACLEACGAALAAALPAIPRMADPDRLELSERAGRKNIPLPAEAPPSPWQLLYGAFKGNLESKRPPSHLDCLRWLEARLAGRAIPLSEILRGSELSSEALGCAQFVDIICAMPASRLYARKSNSLPRFVFGPVERDDFLVMTKATANALAAKRLKEAHAPQACSKEIQSAPSHPARNHAAT
jgi:hypothetical protein